MACGKEKAAYQAWGDKYPPVECSFEDYKKSKPRGQDCIDRFLNIISSEKHVKKDMQEYKNDEYFQRRAEEIFKEEKEAYLTSQTATKEIRELVTILKKTGRGNRKLMTTIKEKDLRIKRLEKSLNKLMCYRGTGKI